MSIKIKAVNSNFEREPLLRPFGFKGGYMSEIWQNVARLQSDSGISKIGLATQNVLWSDARVFAGFSEAAGNAIMYAITDFALQHMCGSTFETPIDLFDSMIDDVYDFAQNMTGDIDLRKTFVLNALVGVDNAAWLLYAAENKLTSFADMIPKEYAMALSHRHERVASIPLMSYNVPVTEIQQAVEQGYFFMKIKIGQPGTQEEMLEKDKARLSEIHAAIGNIQTSYTKDGKLPYYFDANGRYESRETLLQLLDFADSIGALDQIAIIEEPFPEEYDESVHDIPVRLAADESAHTDADAQKRIELGYRAIALKPIAKTLSMTLKIAKLTYIRNVPCFCADLTVNPILVDWNKNVAARLDPFPGLANMGLLETNGHQNYKNWSAMQSHHPKAGADWMRTQSGVFHCDESFFETSGGIFETSEHYAGLVE